MEFELLDNDGKSEIINWKNGELNLSDKHFKNQYINNNNNLDNNDILKNNEDKSKRWQDRIKDLEENEWINYYPDFVSREGSKIFIDYNSNKINDYINVSECMFLPLALGHPKVHFLRSQYDNLFNTKICAQPFSIYVIKTPLLFLLLTGRFDRRRGCNILTELNRIQSLDDESINESILEKFETLKEKLKIEENKCEIHGGDSSWDNTITISNVLNLYMIVVKMCEDGKKFDDPKEQKKYSEKSKEMMENHSKLIKHSYGKLISNIKKDSLFEGLIESLKPGNAVNHKTLPYNNDNIELVKKIANKYSKYEIEYMFTYIKLYEKLIMEFIDIPRNIRMHLLCETRLPKSESISEEIKHLALSETLSSMGWKNKTFGKMPSGERSFNKKIIKKDAKSFNGYLSNYGLFQNLQYLFTPGVDVIKTNNNKNIDLNNNLNNEENDYKMML
jgi:hypothetical protein